MVLDTMLCKLLLSTLSCILLPDLSLLSTFKDVFVPHLEGDRNFFSVTPLPLRPQVVTG